ncbi:hypothetical protein D9V84_11010 [Bacteroidetes/Chlorobi group bacterium Naka2016]|jgi:hypothetical protein|nr:MAG: hypothetical protein D9V84_11010 [Bacteroidetes/Chlorobi group bacterium Naka2016]
MVNKEGLEKFFLKEVEIIQNIINRMVYNSFLIKGWTVTLVVGALLLKTEKRGAIVSLIPLFVFWVLDSYFLLQERRYRVLYKWVINNRLTSEDKLFDLDARRFKDQASSYFGAMFSKTLLLFYLGILILLVLYFGVIF